MIERIEVKTKSAAEKAVKAGKAIRIVGGAFTLSFTGLPVNIEVLPSADVKITLTDCGNLSSRAVLRGSSRAEASGYSFLDVRTRGQVKASPTVCVNLWDGTSCDGGRQQVVNLHTARDWCEYYGARIDGDHAIVYKGVGKGYRSNHGGDYTPGTMPEDLAWNGKKGECERGCGLNFSPTPRHTHEFHRDPAHYLECRIALDEMVVHFGPQARYPQKCTARRVVAPLIECDIDGNHIVPEAA